MRDKRLHLGFARPYLPRILFFFLKFLLHRYYLPVFVVVFLLMVFIDDRAPSTVFFKNWSTLFSFYGGSPVACRWVVFTTIPPKRGAPWTRRSR
jgi:hypothetical protein